VSHVAGRATEDPHVATLGRLTRGALHEIANPLLALVGTAELALDETEPGSKLRGRLETVRSTGHEIATIVRALQAFARQRHEPPRRISLSDAAAEAVALVQLVAAAPDVGLAARSEGEPRVHEPPADVSAALVGLLLDGVAARDSVVVELLVREEGADAVAAVGDHEVRFPRVEEAS
jgi:signal transduction histidine kinase